ncbi:MAG: molybdate ABC transporter permease subunit [Clostridiales bacterium]|nr:molybdate ABC transporter permease subunit [Clostridiales bacterium]
MIHPLWLSLKVSLVATLLVAVTGGVLGFYFSRLHFRGKTLVEALLVLPMVLPPTVLGFVLLYLVSRQGPLGSFLYHTFGIQIVFTWWGAVLASSVVAFPLMYLNATAAFGGVDPKLEMAARTLGKSPFYVFWTITLPLAWPTLLSGIVLSFARALGEFGATLMVAGYIPGKTDTLPLAIFFAVANGEDQKALLYAAIVLVFGFTVVAWVLATNRGRLFR